MRGLVYLKSGRRAVFEYQSPFKRFDYFDGKKHTRYDPDDKQARVESMGKSDDERLLIFLVLGNPGSPWKDEFGEKRELSNPKNPGNKVVQLIPNNRKNILDVTVEVDPVTLLIHRFSFTRVDKSYTEYVFTKIKTTPLDDSLFKFKAPPGIEVFER
jgi:outer membrane lipoprotein-sorting protein